MKHVKKTFKPLRKKTELSKGKAQKRISKSFIVPMKNAIVK